MINISYFLPILSWLPNYKFKFILHDLAAGLTLSTLSIPQSMAYAVLASLPPVYGLYCAMVPPLIYLLFGTSPVQSIGPFAVVALLLGDSTLRTSEWLSTLSKTQGKFSADLPDPWVQYPFIIDLTFYLSFNVGAILFIIYLTNAGKWLSYVLPPKLIEGFISGASIAILTAQIKGFFGVKIPAFTGLFSTIRTWIAVITEFGTINLTAFIMGITSLLIVLGLGYLEKTIRTMMISSSFSLKSWILLNLFGRPELRARSPSTTQPLQDPSSERKPGPNSFPTVLFVVVLATLISWSFELNKKFKMAVVGSVPSGLPPVSFPFAIFNMVPADQISLFVGLQIKDAILIALVTYVSSLSLIKTFPFPLIVDRTAEDVNPQDTPALPMSANEPSNDNSNNHQSVDTRDIYSPIHDDRQEILAISISCILSTFLSCYVPCGSLSKSAVLASQTQVKSPIGNALNACAALIAVLFLTPFFYHMPMSTLSAVIVIALLGTLSKIHLGAVYFMAAVRETWIYNRQRQEAMDSCHPDRGCPVVVAVTSAQDGSDSPPDNQGQEVEITNTDPETAHDDTSADVSCHLQQGAVIPPTSPPVNAKQNSLSVFKSYLTIWKGFILWILTFVSVVVLDSSTGILAGMGTAAFMLLIEYVLDTFEKRNLIQSHS